MLDLAKTKQNLIQMMQSRESSDEAFNTMALEIFGLQFSLNQPFQNYCLSMGKSPDRVNQWHEVPRIHTDAFKLDSYPLSVTRPDAVTRVFLSSGTTTEVRGRHIFPALDIYETAILESWKSLYLPEPQTLVILSSHPDHQPDSSLSYMMQVIARHYPKADIIWAMEKDGRIDFTQLQSLSQQSQPIALLGTALAFLHLFENTTIPLPHGSFAMETGGYKGTQRQMEKSELYALFQRHLSLPMAAVINEYSMTELSSQFYTRGLDQPHLCPPWVRTRVIDPITGTDAQQGEPGHLAIYDLANLYSVTALQTQDIAIAQDNRSFTLVGRDPSALPRGCSRAADQALSS